MWKTPFRLSPFSTISEEDANYSFAFAFFETFYVEDMTSKSFHYEYATIGFLGASPYLNLPATPNPTNNSEILPNLDPKNGSFFIYKNWSVLLTSLFSLVGIFLAICVFIISLKMNKS